MKIKTYIQMILSIILVVLSVWNITGISEKKEDNSYKMSVIIRGKMDDGWENFKKGAENAAEELNVNLRFVASIEGNSAEEQIELLNQEATGTDAILISPIDREKLTEPIQNLQNKKVKMVLFESGLKDDNDVTLICSDNTKIGKELAKKVVNYGNTNKKIMILCGNEKCDSVIKRKEGFVKEMDHTKNQCKIIDQGDFTVEELKKILAKEKIDVAVAMDTMVLENLARASKEYKKENMNAKFQVYGVGCNSEILKYMENEDIVAIAASDDFSIGYLAVEEAMAAIKSEKTKANKKIGFIITNAAQIYTDENQKILFPFVK